MSLLDGLANIKPGILSMKSIVHGGKHYYFQSSNTLVDFSTSVNPLGPSPRVKEVIVRSIDAIVAEYPDNSTRRFRRVAAEYIGVDDSCIVAGNGSSELIYLIADAFLARDDRVLIIEPTFSEYERASLKNSAKVEHIMLEFTFKDEHQSILAERMNGTRLIFICNPNNPTGSVIEKKTMLRVVEEAYNRGVMVLLDECFMEFSSIDCSLARHVEEFNNLIVLRSLTKAFGLAGLRLGYCLANSKLAGVLADAKVPWSVNALAEVAGVEALNDREHIERSKAILTRERDYMHDRLEEVGYSPSRSSVNFFLVRIPDGMNSTTLRDKLLHKGMLVRDCSNFYGLEDGRYIRIAPRLRTDNELLIDAMEDVLDEYGRC
ncbi:MAG: threonine-phosphate decarboxylase CobD [Candidatus Nitrosocaldus sp.]